MGGSCWLAGLASGPDGGLSTYVHVGDERMLQIHHEVALHDPFLHAGTRRSKTVGINPERLLSGGVVTHGCAGGYDGRLAIAGVNKVRTHVNIHSEITVDERTTDDLRLTGT